MPDAIRAGMAALSFFDTEGCSCVTIYLLRGTLWYFTADDGNAGHGQDELRHIRQVRFALLLSGHTKHCACIYWFVYIFSSGVVAVGVDSGIDIYHWHFYK
jgi:hypothetical protein